MAEKLDVVSQQFLKPIKILKWKVSEGYFVSMGTILLIYDFGTNLKKEQRKLKSTRAGSVHKLLVDEGAIVNPGELLLELKPCIHPTVMKDMCAECGADLRKEEIDSTASVPMIHTVPDLKVSKELAHKIGKADEERLLRDRKLVLLVDLDQTLIHTTNDIIPPNIKDVYHFQLYGPHSPWYHTRLRPGTQQFLTNIFPYFELHICTFGARNYAHKITQLLDPDGRFFSNRVLSRDECFNPTSKTANLSALFPCGDHMVCIIDDREDVWSYATNLIHVKPYHFFQHTGDINAPPGLDKHEDDEKVGVDLTKIVPKEDKGTITDDNPSENVEEPDNFVENCDEESNVEDTEKNEEIIQEEEKETPENISTNKENGNVEKESKKVNGTLENTEEQKIVEANKANNSPNQNINTTNDKGIQAESSLEKHTETVVDSNLEACIQAQENENIPKVDVHHTKSSLNSSLNLIVIDDPDDYLLYLEDILKTVHKTFYEHYDVMESGAVPDLKKIIPEVKSQILQGTKLCFSGLVPTHIKLELSKAFQIARSLGAEVTQDLEENTTHLVAVRRGTAKVNAGRRKKNLHIVTPDWLWACAERWERASEKLFPLSNKGSKNRHPPPHCSSPEHVSDYGVHNTPAARKRTDSGRFMDTINPLMSFSTDDIADMDKEVEDTLEDGDSESERDAARSAEEPEGITENLGKSNNYIADIQKETENSSSEESITAEMPRGHKRPLKRKRRHDRYADDDDELGLDGNESSDSDTPSVKFRRGEDITSEVDMGSDSNSQGSMDAPDEVDDGEWNMMGAALEREFLSNN